MNATAKRLATAALVLVLLLGLLPAPALAGLRPNGSNPPWDNNATPADALTLTPNVQVAAGPYNSYSYTRWWKFTLDAPGTVSVTFSSEATTFGGKYLDYLMMLFSEPVVESAPLQRRTFTSNGSVQRSASIKLPAGTHYVSIKPQSTALNVKVYQFTLNYTPIVLVSGVSLDAASKTLEVGDGFTLTPTVLPANADNPALSWSSSSPAVAWVGNGRVTALAAGTTVITATAQDGSGHSAGCTVTVNKKPAPGKPDDPAGAGAAATVTNVQFGQAGVVLKQGASITLPAYAYTSDGKPAAVSYASSNPSLARVDGNGKITAAQSATGTAKITATAGGKSATLSVQVVSRDVPAIKVKSISAKVPATMRAGQKRTIKPRYKPANAQGVKFTFKSSKKAVLSVDKFGRLVAKKKGKAVITIKGGGKVLRFRVRVR